MNGVKKYNVKGEVIRSILDLATSPSYLVYRDSLNEEARVILEAAYHGIDDWWREIAAEALVEEGEHMSNDQQMMGRLNKVVFLRQVLYFTDLSLEELGLIASIAEEQTCMDDDKLLQRGEPNPAMYVIVDGNVGD